MRTITLKIEGMHCKSCEMLINDVVSEIEGVKKTEASLKNNSAKVEFDESKADLSKIRKAIESEGYKIKQ